ncbi:M56 family metallopeptidase [Amycolatopsis taiwanensis]|uniref:M56 family metallopeptidase n=1 Tax=Amycolatopsis taiwanensis TaxID=342230 RepID=UPI0004889F56|nr:M56 family metallopeptidase [Amycolatopsis taiwanensis]
MDVAEVIVPLLLPLIAWPAAHWAAPRLPPPWASWLLTASCVVLTIASTAALVVPVLAGLTLLPAIATADGVSPADLLDSGAVSIPLAAFCGLALVVLAISAWRSGLRYRAWFRALHTELDRHSRDGGVIIVPDREPVAFAVPGRGGRIVVSGGLLSALRPRERSALLAHEAAHLRLRHHVFLGAIAASCVLNPLVRPLGGTARFALERWADEVAAHRVGDRRILATAVAKAALATRTAVSFAPGAAGGHVPRRVAALLATPRPRSVLAPVALLGMAVVLGVTAGAAGTALDSATDLHADIEIARQGLCPPGGQETMLGQAAYREAAFVAVRQQNRQCAES